MVKLERKNLIGKLLLLVERCRFYVAWLQFVMIAYLTIVQTNVDLTFIYYLIPFMFVLLIIDWKFILPQNNYAASNKNPFLVEMNKKIIRIENKLEEKSKL